MRSGVRGLRIVQACHSLERARPSCLRSKREDGPAIVDASPGHPEPVFALRTLKSIGAVYCIDGPLDELDAIETG